MSSHRYRPDIDGLRALAVIPVLLFHADAGFFQGGYVGVDVFFVISGYLITGLILQDIQEQRFSIVRFYERRVRRIFPALFTVVACSIVMASFLFLPSHLAAFGRSVIATTLFVSNVFFYNESGYFEAPAEETPLLHTWSLAVEEQFYIVFPLFLLAVRRYLGGRYALSASAVVAGTFVLSLWGVGYDRSATFYLAPTRAWELGLGTLLATGAVPLSKNLIFRHTSGIAGLAMVTYSILFFSDRTAFPGAAAAIPCLGTALIIWAGTEGDHVVGRMLRVRPLVAVGLMSYSLYLWHWPLLTVARYRAMRDLTAGETAVVLGLAVLASALSWRFIERPFRGGLVDRRRLFTLAGGAMTATAGVGLIVAGFGGLPIRVHASVLQIDDRPRQTASDVSCLHVSPERLRTRALCRIGDPEATTPAFVVWGDSHAAALSSAVGSAAARQRASAVLAIRSGCTPLLGVSRVGEGSRERCVPFNRAVLDYLGSSSSPENVLIIARWAHTAEASRYGVERGPSPFLVYEESTATSQGENRVLFRRAMLRSVDALLALGKRVWVLASVPEVGWNVRSVLARARMWTISVAIEPTVREYTLRQAAVDETLRELQRTRGVGVLRPDALLCDTTTCNVTRQGQLLYRDDDHLSTAGAELLVPLFEQMFAEAATGNPELRTAVPKF